MHLEIEKKFLIENIDFELERYEKLEIIQAYISFKPVIRLRKSNENYYLTVKGFGLMVKDEFEMPIEKEQFEYLWKKTEAGTVSKTRYNIPIHCGLIAELDIYHNELSGLMTVEVEFPDTKTAENFTHPEWFGKEVTEDRRYSNSSLARYGKPCFAQ